MESRYDFPAMEDRISFAYASFFSEGKKGPVSELVKTELYTAIKTLTDIIVLDKALNKMKLSNEDISYNYAVDLYERLITGALRPKNKNGSLVTNLGHFPWNSYIRKNIKNTVENLGKDTLWSELITELDAVPSEEELKDRSYDNWEEEQNSMNENIDHDRLSIKLYKYMQAHFNDKELNRLWPLASELIYRDGDKPIPANIPDHVANFLRTYIGGARRLSRQYNIRISFDEMSVDTLKKAQMSAANSTLFLSTVVNDSVIRRSLLLACDINTLYTLVYLEGGKEIKIPTLRQLESTQAAVQVVSKMILQGKNFPDLRYKKGQGKLDGMIDLTIEELDLTFANKRDTRHIASKMIEIYNLHPFDDHGDPTIDLLIVASKALGSVALRLPDAVEKGTPLKDVLKMYRALSSMQSKLQARNAKATKNFPETVFSNELERLKSSNVISKLVDSFEEGLRLGVNIFSVNREQAEEFVRIIRKS